MNIAIVGAPGSGKTALANCLRAALDPAQPHTVLDSPSLDPAPASALNPAPAWDVILLCALERPPAHAGQPQEQRQSELALRAQLERQALPYATLCGSLPARCASALQVIRLHRGDLPPATNPGRWRWPCEKCSDPACEHRLFSALVQGAAEKS